MHSMTLEQLRATAAAGGVAGVTLKGQGGAFMLRIATRSGQDAVLAKARSTEPRRFGNPASAIVPGRPRLRTSSGSVGRPKRARKRPRGKDKDGTRMHHGCGSW